MSIDAAFQMQLGAALLLSTVSVMLILLQLDRLDRFKRRIALASIATFLVGATTIFYLEEIKSYLWDGKPVKRIARVHGAGAGWSGGGGMAGHGGAGVGRNGGEAGEDEGQDAQDEESSRALTVKVRHNRFQDCPSCPEMVIIPAAEATSGHAAIPGFAIGRFEITVEEFDVFVAVSGHKSAALCEGAIAAAGDRVIGARGAALTPYLRAGRAGSGGRPVSCVSWIDAQAYATWLSRKTGRAYRLVTAPEWSHAAKGGEDVAARTTPTSIATTRAMIHRAAMTRATAYDVVTPDVATSPSNRFGVFDMAGNVAEWVDGCASNAAGLALGTRGCQHRTMGGSWADGASITAVGVADPSHAATTIGFRVARDLSRPVVSGQ